MTGTVSVSFLSYSLVHYSIGQTKRKRIVQFSSRWCLTLSAPRLPCLPPIPTLHSRSGVPRTQKLKPRLLRTHSSEVLPFKPGAGPYIATRATPTARDFFLANFYPSGPFTCIFFSKSLPSFYRVICD